MRLVLGTICLCFVGFALLQVNDPHSGLWFYVYAFGALVSAICLRDGLHRHVYRLFAISTMLLMFFYFFGFFQLAPNLYGSWWQSATALEAVGLLFGAFAMIPVLSTYSCRLKATCADITRRAPAVFSAPAEPRGSAAVETHS
jgi:hypothetical protein